MLGNSRLRYGMMPYGGYGGYPYSSGMPLPMSAAYSGYGYGGGLMSGSYPMMGSLGLGGMGSLGLGGMGSLGMAGYGSPYMGGLAAGYPANMATSAYIGSPYMMPPMI